MNDRKISLAMRLRRVPDFDLRVRENARMAIRWNDRSWGPGLNLLAILDAFAQPRTLREGLDILRSQVSGAQQWMDFYAEISELYRVGVLYDTASSEPARFPPGDSYAGSAIHHFMLRDKLRTERYIDAIRRVVRPGDVVVDVGTGTGVLAIAAAQAGASKVYAVEASQIGSLAQAMFERNGVADRVTLVEGMSTQVSLPERADVMVSEMIGDEPLSERIQEVTRDAVSRFLKPGGRLLPSRIKVCALPVEIPDHQFQAKVVTRSATEDWQRWYGIDFSEFLAFSRRDQHYVQLKPQEMRDWTLLSTPVVLADVDLAQCVALLSKVSVDGTFQESGLMNGVVVYFDAELAPGVWLSTHPHEAGDSNHWFNLVRIHEPGVQVAAGAHFSISYRYGKGVDQLAISMGGARGP